jgi:hypothetical protein
VSYFRGQNFTCRTLVFPCPPCPVSSSDLVLNHFHVAESEKKEGEIVFSNFVLAPSMSNTSRHTRSSVGHEFDMYQTHGPRVSCV